jgi:predicted transport protein
MGAAKRLDGNYPDKQYLDKGEREGWVTVQEISMKRIIVDPAYQARDIPTKSPVGISVNMNHVKELAAIRDLNNGEFLAPIVVFLAPDGRFLLADGFHRHEENRQRRGKSIRAFVVKSADHEHEARLFAAMCNQQLCLARTSADKRKAVELLFADQETWDWSDTRIAIHCGANSRSVMKYRADYMAKYNISAPTRTITSIGRKRIYKNISDRRKNKNNKLIGCKTKQGYIAFTKTIDGKCVYLGKTEEEAKLKLTVKLNEIRKNRETGRIKINSNINYDFLACRGLSFNSTARRGGNGSKNYLSGYHGHGLIYIITEFQDKRDVPAAVGSLRLLRLKMNMPDARLVVLCYPEDGPQDLIELARQDGIEFFTPEGLVANLKGTEPQEEKEPEGDLPCT